MTVPDPTPMSANRLAEIQRQFELGFLSHAARNELFAELRRLQVQSEARRRLLEKHQWAVSGIDGIPYACPECDDLRRLGHADNCALAAAIQTDFSPARMPDRGPPGGGG